MSLQTATATSNQQCKTHHASNGSASRNVKTTNRGNTVCTRSSNAPQRPQRKKDVRNQNEPSGGRSATIGVSNEGGVSRHRKASAGRVVNRVRYAATEPEFVRGIVGCENARQWVAGG